jgi:hypothetical protein
LSSVNLRGKRIIFQLAPANSAAASVYECLRKPALSAKMNVSACAREAP